MNVFVQSRFSPAPDNTEHVERVGAWSFAYELALVLVMFVLLPLTDAPQETGTYQTIPTLQALFFKLPCLLVMLSLCVSVMRNNQRSGLAKLLASASAGLVVCLLYTPVTTMFRSLLS